VRLFGEKSWLCRHVLTDWLAATWFFLYATLLWYKNMILLLPVHCMHIYYGKKEHDDIIAADPIDSIHLALQS
jgi:hypothetical protein